MKEIIKTLSDKFEFIIQSESENHATILLANAQNILHIVQEVKIMHKFKMLIDVCGVDYPSNQKRFEVVYQFLNLEDNLRLTIKLQVQEGEPVPSITKIHKGACWFERETFDMYGILFSETHDLRRILTDYNFEGFPLRKDFPLTGFVELHYDATVQKIVQTPVRLSQEHRNFDFESPWQNVQYEVKKS